MLLSIPIINDWLKDKVLDARCINGRMDIESIRLYSGGNDCSGKKVLYIGTSDSFFRDGKNNIICKNQNDYLVLDTDDLIETVNQVHEAFDYYATWYAKCTELLRNGGSLDDLLELSTALFPTPIIIVDAAQTIIAVSSPRADFQNTSEWAEAQSRGSVSEDHLKRFNLANPDVYSYTHVFPVEPEYFFTKGYCKHIFINGARRATVVLKDPYDEYSRGRLQLFDLYTDILKEWIISRGESDTSFRMNSYFARALSGDEDAVSAMIRQTLLFGWNENCRKVLFILAPVSDNTLFDMHMINEFTHEAKGTYAMAHKNNVIILSNSDILDHAAFSNVLQNFLFERHFCGSVSFAFTDMHLLEQAYKVALSAFEHNPKIAGVIYHSQDTSMRRIAGILREQSAQTLLHPALAVIRDFDRKNRTDYYNTLFCYLKNERKHQQTAEELFIHRNTLFQRLQKIQDIWPLDLDDADERFHLLFSFYQEYYNQK